MDNDTEKIKDSSLPASLPESADAGSLYAGASAPDAETAPPGPEPSMDEQKPAFSDAPHEASVAEAPSAPGYSGAMPPIELEDEPPPPPGPTPPTAAFPWRSAPAVPDAAAPPPIELSAAGRGANTPRVGKDADKPRPRHRVLHFAKEFVVESLKVLMIVLLLRAYVLQASSVEGHSMENTLHDGDLLLVERFTMSLINSPPWFQAAIPDAIMPHVERGDIVVLTSPENGNSELVKRVIAVAGETIFFSQGYIYVNGRKLDEPYLSPKVLAHLGRTRTGEFRHYDEQDIGDMPDVYRVSQDDFESALEDNTLEQLGVRIPDGCVFVMGDNRERKRSNDSRAWTSIGGLNSSPGQGHLWVTVKSIHGRVLSRLRLPWDYDAENPVFPK